MYVIDSFNFRLYWLPAGLKTLPPAGHFEANKKLTFLIVNPKKPSSTFLWTRAQGLLCTFFCLHSLGGCAGWGDLLRPPRSTCQDLHGSHSLSISIFVRLFRNAGAQTLGPRVQTFSQLGKFHTRLHAPVTDCTPHMILLIKTVNNVTAW